VLKETEVTVFDRRTGDLVTKKTFPPDSGCPMFTFRSAGEDTQDSSMPRTKIQSWLRTQIKR
jgi:hypothetical protein